MCVSLIAENVWLYFCLYHYQNAIVCRIKQDKDFIISSTGAQCKYTLRGRLHTNNCVLLVEG
jgi:hypothetical protein